MIAGTWEKWNCGILTQKTYTLIDLARYYDVTISLPVPPDPRFRKIVELLLDLQSLLLRALHRRYVPAQLAAITWCLHVTLKHRFQGRFRYNKHNKIHSYQK